MKKIPLSRGRFALVDDEDFGLVNTYKWHYTHGYARCDARDQKLYMHRLIMGAHISLVDHRNGNTLDNRRANLRIASKSLNALNRRKIRGVSRHLDHWRAYITIDGVQNHLGCFPRREEAVEARRLVEKKYG